MSDANLFARDHQLSCHIIMLRITDQEHDKVIVSWLHQQVLGLTKAYSQYFLLLEKLSLLFEL
jgi:hypothetical protein